MTEEFTDPTARSMIAYEGTINQLTEAYRRASEAERLTMYTQDGKRVYSDEEHAKRLPAHEQRTQQLLAKFRSDVGGYETLAQEKTDKARRELTAMNGDPLDRLNGEELQAAVARRTFIAEDVEKASFGTLIKRIESAAQGDDKVLKALLQRYGMHRLEAETEKQILGGDNVLPSEEMRALRSALQTLDDPKAKQKRASVQQIIEAADKLRGYVHKAKLHADPDVQNSLKQRFGI